MLENKGRGPVVIELPGAAHQRPQEVVLLGRDPATGDVGRRVVTRSFPVSLTLQVGEKSPPLPIELKDAPELRKPGVRVLEIGAEPSSPAEEPAPPVKE